MMKERRILIVAPFYPSPSRLLRPMSDLTRRLLMAGALILLLLFAFGLRLFRLDAQSIWWDEGISLHLATASLAEIVANRVTNIHPPLYFIGLKGWAALVGASAFSGRYLSALASLLQVAAVYAVSRRWFSRSSAHIAAILLALSPLSVIYGQEIRVYAVLPLVYLALLAITQRLIQERFGKSFYIRNFLLLGLVEWIGLHLHYIVFLAVAYISAWALLAFYRQRRWLAIRFWAVTHFFVGLASLPWFVAVLTNWTAVQREANAGAFLAEPASLPFLISQVWVFHLTGLPGALRLGQAQSLAALIAVLLVLLLLLHTWKTTRSTSAPTSVTASLKLLAHWLVPLSSALFIWSVRSFSHPRYISIYAIGMFPLVAYLAYPGSRRAGERGLGTRLRLGSTSPPLYSLLSAALILSLIAVSLIGLHAYFFDPSFAKDDMREVARYLETAASAGDLILVPDGGWAFPIEYKGQATVLMPGLADHDEMWSQLQRTTRGQQRVFTVDSSAGSLSDWQDIVPFALEKAGSLIGEKKFNGLLIRSYELARFVEPPPLTPWDARFGPLVLVGAWVESGAPADSAVAVALRWQLSVETGGGRDGAGLRLLDSDGWPLAAADRLLLDENGQPTEYWAPGQTVTTYHLLPLASGTPPLEYTVALELYRLTESEPRPVDLIDEQGAPQGRQVALAVIELAPALGLADNPYRLTNDLPSLPEPVELADGLWLLAAIVDRNTARSGQPLFIHLRWQAATHDLPALHPRLSLVQDGQELAFVEEAPASGRYPTDRWRPGEMVREHRSLVVPPNAAGRAEVVLSVGERSLVLAEVEIEAEERVFEPPAVAYPLDVQFGDLARLVGYDLPQREFTTARPIPVTLYWQSLSAGPTIDYTVFVHLLAADGNLIAQHDAPPDNGRRPTGSWVTGEFIVDPHEMTFREPGYAGQARIEVGLYNPDTGERLPTPDGGDFVYLPVEVTVSGD
ncbi:MAG TPA: glycosyltransferase family 39 protein [Anaerolineae bacterium]